MTVTKQDYENLVKSVDEIKQQRAVMAHRNIERGKQLKIEEDKLSQLGIDVENIPDEIVRLEGEIQSDYDQTQAEVQAFQERMVPTEVKELSQSPAEASSNEMNLD